MFFFLTIIFFFFCFFQLINKSTTSAPTITKPNRNEWLISIIGNTTEQATSKDNILISMSFNASNRDIGALVFEADCITPFDSNTYFNVDTTMPSSNAPDGFIQFNTTLEMNVTAINGTKHWNAFTDGTRGGWVEACTETYLQVTDDPDLGNDDVVQKVTFKNNVLNISISLNADYNVDQVSVVREEATKEDVKTDYSEFITAYECAEINPYLPVTGKTYNQGDEIGICVTDESGGIVQVEEFVDLVVAQEGLSDYNFILNTLYNPDVTTPECLDATSSERRVCIAKIRALARFFEGAAPKDLTISGSVYVIRDGRRVRRNLRMGLPAPEKINEEADTALVASGRRDEEDEEGSGDFEVIVSLASTDDSAASNRIIGSTAAAGLVSMVVGAVGAALMV